MLVQGTILEAGDSKINEIVPALSDFTILLEKIVIKVNECNVVLQYIL